MINLEESKITQKVVFSNDNSGFEKAEIPLMFSELTMKSDLKSTREEIQNPPVKLQVGRKETVEEKRERFKRRKFKIRDIKTSYNLNLLKVKQNLLNSESENNNSEEMADKIDIFELLNKKE